MSRKPVAVLAVLAVLAVVLMIAGCKSLKKEEKTEGISGEKTNSAEEAKKKAIEGAMARKRAEMAKADKMTPPKPVLLSGAHVLVSFKGAMRAKAEITISKEDALKRAQEIAKKAKEAPEKFADLAREYSDCPSGAQGGDLGTWHKGRMVPAFDQAIEKLKVGEVSDVVETQFGYHVMIRREVKPPVDVAAAQIMIAYEGAMRARPDVKRTKDAAMKLAEKLAVEAAKNPAKFAELAKKHSDGPEAVKGGDMGTWNTGQPRMPSVFTNAILALEIGGISKVVETPFGYHVFKRAEIPPLYAGSHILISYKGAMRVSEKVTRTKKEAKELADKLSKEAQAAPDKFMELAARNSDDPSAARGGSLGSWRKGMMVPVFDEAVEKLKEGEISDPVESPFGFHIIKREAPPKAE
ncbi:MAG: peptidylprolyl isomerase [Pseudomonadota bacterium]